MYKLLVHACRVVVRWLMSSSSIPPSKLRRQFFFPIHMFYSRIKLVSFALELFVPMYHRIY